MEARSKEERRTLLVLLAINAAMLVVEAGAGLLALFVLANLAVILAGLLVRFTGSSVPDLVTGLGIAALVLAGGVKILREARLAEAAPACSGA